MLDADVKNNHNKIYLKTMYEYGSVSPDNFKTCFSKLTRDRLFVKCPINTENSRIPSLVDQFVTVDLPVFFFSQRWDQNYRHFLMETLGNAMLAKDFLERNPGGNVAVIESKFPEYVRFALESVGIPNSSIIKLRDGELLRTPNGEFCTDFASKELQGKVINLMIRHAHTNHNVVPVPASSPVRIFLDRKELDHMTTNDKHFHSRRITNKGRLYELIETKQCSVIEPGTLPYGEQINTIQGADTVVTEISAACDNILFSKPGSTFVILHATNTASWAKAYTPIADERGVKLVTVCCGTPITNVANKNGDHLNFPWCIDYDIVEQSISQW